MRLLSFNTGGDARYGIVDASGLGVIDLTHRIDGVSDLSDLLAQQRVDDAHQFAHLAADYLLDSITYDRLLPTPGKIFCIGVNYGGRSAEYEDKSDAAYPSVFPRFAHGFTGHEQAVIRPPESEQLDYEGEIVVVIGKAGRRIPEANARDHIAGLSLGNEGTIRDWVRHAKFNVTQGKNWENSGSMGPWLVTLDQFDSFEQLHLTTHVNGELRQDDTPATMKYSIEYQIHYLSTFNTLMPGDVIYSGTPVGAGARFDPPVWLEPGDVIEVAVPEIGVLRNYVADEFPQGSDYKTPEPK